MFPSPSLPPIDDISRYWTDEELCMSLDKMIHGSCLPGNVIPDVNPFQYNPSDLRANVWYFIRSGSGMQKEAETGLWKSKGKSCRIFTDPVITGWRTTYKYYEGQCPNERRTDWAMQEYRLTKGMHENSSPKDAGSLCRVILSNVQGPNNEMQQHLASKQNVVSGESISSILSELLGEENNRNGQGFTSRSNVNSRDDETNTVPVTEGLFTRSVENMPDIDGDYLELLDLVTPASPSSSSENSSCLSMTSDEYFDSLALLRDLESEDKNDHQRKNADCKFSILASARPNGVVMHLATAGSVVSGNRNKTPAESLKTDSSPLGSAVEQKSHDKTLVKPAIISRKAENDNGVPPSKSCNVAASSSGHRAGLVSEKETVTGKKTRRKKYFCFKPF